MDNIEVSLKNSEFWDEMCGSGLAKFLGITDASLESLRKFDDWYFNFYPYLFDHIPFGAMQAKDVLEVGLGYGTVSQRLAQCGARYTGLDIAAGPVEMVLHRFKQNALLGAASQGNILKPESPESSFDYVVAIGCLHHTGNLRLAIENCWRLLRPGGQLIFMVYYAYSYRRIRMAPAATLRYMMRELGGHRGVVGVSGEHERAAYDTSSSGAGAPHTDWTSVRSLREYCQKFNQFSATIENIDQETPFGWTPRETLLATKWPRRVGLDLYATAIK